MVEERGGERAETSLIVRRLGEHVRDDDQVYLERAHAGRAESGFRRFAHEIAGALFPPFAEARESGAGEKDVLSHIPAFRQRALRRARGIRRTSGMSARARPPEAAVRL